MSPGASLAAGLHERASASASAQGSHWSATAPLSIPAPESSRFLYAAPFHSPHAQAAMHAAMGAAPSAHGHAHSHPHAHALGPHESMHAYPPSNVSLAAIGGSAGSLSARPSLPLSSRGSKATAASLSLALTGRSRRVWRDPTPPAAESIVAAAVNPFHAPTAGPAPPAAAATSRA